MPKSKGVDTTGKGSTEKPFQIAAPSISLPKGGGAIRGSRGEVCCESGDWYRIDVAADRDLIRSFWVWPTTLPFLRLRCRQWAVRVWLEPLATFDHPQDRQGPVVLLFESIRRESLGQTWIK